MGLERKKIILFVLIGIFISAMLVYIVFDNYYFIYSVKGKSMEPTLHGNDRLIVKKIHNIHTLKRFDIIVFKNKDDKSKLLIKRIIGLYGENIDIKDNIVFINGSKLSEPFLINTSNIKANILKKKGEFSYKSLNGFFLLGDNRNISRDSRTFGLISEDNIIGKAVLTYFPFKRLN